MVGISIIIPVGADADYQKYMPECIASIEAQMSPFDEIVVVLDGHDCMDDTWYRWQEWTPSDDSYDATQKRYLILSWRVGPAAAWNLGVGEALNDWCILMGSDDKLLPGCLDACRDVIADKPDPYGYYNLTCEISSGEMIDLHNNAAMISKKLWEKTGGFPIEAFAAMDACFISGMLAAVPRHLHQIKKGTPLYWVREWQGQFTYYNSPYQGVILDIRNIFTSKAKREWRF